MSFRARIVAVKIIGLLCLFTFASSTKTQNVDFINQDVPDHLIYAQVFHLVSIFERETTKTQSEQDKIFLENYFKKKLNLSEEQNQILKTVAHNFTNEFALSDSERKIKLFLSYKDDLKNSFGEKEFNRFDKLIREQIVPKMSLSRIGDSFGIGGYSSLSLDEKHHKLIGLSVTLAFSLQPDSSIECAVGATMTGPNVSLSGSASNDCSDHPRVTLISTTYLSNSPYCINGTHTRSPFTMTSSECSGTPDTPRITNVSYEQISTDDLPIDANPEDNNTAVANGLRIFPDKKNPNDGVDRRKIRVKAQYYQATAGVRIYFRNLDVDDPSANSAPIDDEPTPNAGDDNNGNVDGTSATKAGKLSIPSPNPNSCQTWANGVSCLTDANGLATVDFTTTRQPGDNFTVVAGADEVYITNLTSAADGINLKDANNIQTPVATTTSNACATSSILACRTDMLTVWRRMHIEVDSLSASSENYVIGTIASTTILRTNQTVAINLNPIGPSHQLPIEQNSYEGGRLVVGSRSFPIVCNYNNGETCNTTDTVTIRNTGNNALLTAGNQFQLYDDDDFNDNDGAFPDGDTGEDIPGPDEVNATNTLQSNDIVCSQTVQENCNVLAPAYIRPMYDITGDVTDNSYFITNMETNGYDFLDITFDQIETQDSPDYWTVLFFGGYQQGRQPLPEYPPIPRELGEDGDPADPNLDGNPPNGCSEASYGFTTPVTSVSRSLGIVFNMELGRPHEYPNNYVGRPVSRAWTAAHEIGHLFGGDHLEEGLMTPTCTRSALDGWAFKPMTIKVIRSKISP